MTGEEFLGWEGCGNGARVLYIDLEQDLVIAQRRMVETWYPGAWNPEITVPEMIGGKLRPEFSDAYYCRWSEGLALNSSDTDRAVVEETIKRVEPDLVVFDPLYKSFEGNPNEQELAVSVMRILDDWRERYGFGLLLGAHMRKPSGQGNSFTKHDVSSSGAWIFGAEVVLGIRRLAGNGAALHFFKDRAGDLPTGDAWTLEYSVNGGYERSAIDATPEGETLAAPDRIWALLQNVNGRMLTRTQLSTILHIPPKTVRNATERLEERAESGAIEGLVTQTGSSGNLYGHRMKDDTLSISTILEAIGREADPDGF